MEKLVSLDELRAATYRDLGTALPIWQVSNFVTISTNMYPMYPYISLGAAPTHILMPIPAQNRALDATRVPPSLPLPVVAATSIPKPSLQIKPRADREKPRT
jgi:hypothetical protein